MYSTSFIGQAYAVARGLQRDVERGEMGRHVLVRHRSREDDLVRETEFPHPPLDLSERGPDADDQQAKPACHEVGRPDGIDQVGEAVPIAQPADEAGDHAVVQAVFPAHLLAGDGRVEAARIDGVVHDRQPILGRSPRG